MNDDLKNIQDQIKKRKEPSARVEDSANTEASINVEPDKITDSKTEQTDSTPQNNESNLPEIPKQTQYIKPIDEIDSSDFSLVIDRSKSIKEQASDIAGAAAVVNAVKDETVREQMSSYAGEQLVEASKAEVAQARAERIKADTEEQKSKSDLYQSLLETFGAYKHYPEWLRKIIVGMFTLPYLLLLFIIGIPTGIIQFTIERVDGIFVRYESVDDARKPKVRFTTWLLLGTGIAAIVALIILRSLHVI